MTAPVPDHASLPVTEIRNMLARDREEFRARAGYVWATGSGGGGLELSKLTPQEIRDRQHAAAEGRNVPPWRGR